MNTYHNQFVKPLLSEGLTLPEASKRASLDKALDGFVFMGVICNQIHTKKEIICSSFICKDKLFTADNLKWIHQNNIHRIDIPMKLHDTIKGLAFHQVNNWILSIVNDNGLTITIKAYYLESGKVKHEIKIVLAY